MFINVYSEKSCTLHPISIRPLATGEAKGVSGSRLVGETYPAHLYFTSFSPLLISGTARKRTIPTLNVHNFYNRAGCEPRP
jgi:hypothetical protein